MTHVEMNSLEQYLIDHCDHQMEPVLIRTDNGKCTLAFQPCDVGFPFREYQAIAVNAGQIAEMPMEQWLSLLKGVDCLKIDLRTTTLDVEPMLRNMGPGVDLKLSCQNCDLTGRRSDFVSARDLLERVELGEQFTDSECAECGALAHPDEKNYPLGWHVMEMFMRKIDECESSLSDEEAMHDLSKLAMSLALLPPKNAVHYAKEALEDMKEEMSE